MIQTLDALFDGAALLPEVPLNIKSGTRVRIIMNEIFLDTSFTIALSAITDQNHARAVELAEQIEAQNSYLVTTQAILLEIGNALSKQRYRTAAIQLLESHRIRSKR